ncbi:MAG: 6-phosphofructokinase, partial [Candidatus Omnitrophota bacterium]
MAAGSSREAGACTVTQDKDLKAVLPTACIVRYYNGHGKKALADKLMRGVLPGEYQQEFYDEAADKGIALDAPALRGTALAREIPKADQDVPLVESYLLGGITIYHVPEHGLGTTNLKRVLAEAADLAKVWVGAEAAAAPLAWNAAPVEKRVGVMLSGGDCAGTNCLVGYLYNYLKEHGFVVAGIKGGLDGLVEKEAEKFQKAIMPVSDEMSAQMPFWPSFEFGSTRKSLKINEKATRIEEEDPETQVVLKNIRENFGVLLIIGGNDHLNEGRKLDELLRKYGIPFIVVGAPKTIDGDTLYTKPLGLESAAQALCEYVYRAAALPGSGECVIIETMGRDCGALAARAGDKRIEEVIKFLPAELHSRARKVVATMQTYVPEYPISVKEIRRRAQEMMQKVGAITIICSEGLRLSGEDPDLQDVLSRHPLLKEIKAAMKKDAHGNLVISQGIAAEFLSAILEEYSPRIEVAGFTPRGAAPVETERKIAEEFSRMLSNAIASGQSGKVSVYCDDLRYPESFGKFSLIPFAEVCKKDAAGHSLSKNIKNMFTLDELERMGVVIRENQPIAKAEKAANESRIKNALAMALAFCATAISAWAHKRPSVFYIGGKGADNAISSLMDFFRQSDNAAVRYVRQRSGSSILVLDGEKYRSLSEVMDKAYQLNSLNKHLNVIVSEQFRIKKGDGVIAVLEEMRRGSLPGKIAALQASLATAEEPEKKEIKKQLEAKQKQLASLNELSLRLQAADKPADAEFYVFDSRGKALAQVIKLIFLNVPAPLNPQDSKPYKQLADVRLTAMDRALETGILPAEKEVAAAGVDEVGIDEKGLTQQLAISPRLGRFFKKYKINPAKTFLFAMSGGDCAGPNSAYYGAVMEAARRGYAVLGVMNGFSGLGAEPEVFADNLFIFTPKTIERLRYAPSIHLGSSRAKFKDKKDNILINARPFKGVIFIGGDEHSNQADELAQCGIPTIVIPKTIDYDFLAEALGAQSAAQEARMLYLRAHQLAREEKFIQVIELMGRDAGWITYLAAHGISQASFILLPERPSYFKDILLHALDTILTHGYLTIAMAEGYNFIDFEKKHKEAKDTLFYKFLELNPVLKAKFNAKGQFDVHGNPKLSGISEYLSLAIRYTPQLAELDNGVKEVYTKLKRKYPAYFGKDLRYEATGELMRNVLLSIPGYILRGLPPANPQDKKTEGYDAFLGECYGRRAVTFLLEGKNGLEVTIKKQRKIRTIGWLRRKLKDGGFIQAVPIAKIVKKEYVARHYEEEKKNKPYGFADEKLAKTGVWWQGCQAFQRQRGEEISDEKPGLGLETRELARRLFLSTAVSACMHNVPSVFGFRGIAGIDSDSITLYAADQNPRGKLPGYQQYCLEETAGSTIILLSTHPAYLRDLLVEVLKRMNGEIKIRDEQRIVKKTVRGYVNLAVSDKYKLLDFEEAIKRRGEEAASGKTSLFSKLLELDPVLNARYQFNRYFFDHGQPGFMELLHTFTSAITYLPQLAEYDAELKAGIEKLQKKRKEIFGKDPEREDRLIIKGVRLNRPNQIIGKSHTPQESELKRSGVWWPKAQRPATLPVEASGLYYNCLAQYFRSQGKKEIAEALIQGLQASEYQQHFRDGEKIIILKAPAIRTDVILARGIDIQWINAIRTHRLTDGTIIVHVTDGREGEPLVPLFASHNPHKVWVGADDKFEVSRPTDEEMKAAFGGDTPVNIRGFPIVESVLIDPAIKELNAIGEHQAALLLFDLAGAQRVRVFPKELLKTDIDREQLFKKSFGLVYFENEHPWIILAPDILKIGHPKLTRTIKETAKKAQLRRDFSDVDIDLAGRIAQQTALRSSGALRARMEDIFNETHLLRIKKLHQEAVEAIFSKIIPQGELAGSIVLDLNAKGCADVRKIALDKGCETVVDLDISPPMLLHEAQRLAEFDINPLRAGEIGERKPKIITLVNVLEFYPYEYKRRILAQAKGLLGEGGYLVIMFRSSEETNNKNQKYGYFGIEDYIRLLEIIGFNEVGSRVVNSESESDYGRDGDRDRVVSENVIVWAKLSRKLPQERPVSSAARMCPARKYSGRKNVTVQIESRVYAAMANEDRSALNKICTCISDELDELIFSSGGRITTLYQEDEFKRKKEGREVFLHLEKPVVIDGLTLSVLRFKGSKPKVRSNNQVLVYRGQGCANETLSLDRDGNIIVKKGSDLPWGTEPCYPLAQTEFEVMRAAAESRFIFNSDYPVGIGYYDDLRFGDQPVGFVICGMEDDDLRLDLGADGPLMAKSNAGEGKERFIIDPPQDSTVYSSLGRMLRNMHEQGWAHLFPHMGNIGIVRMPEGRSKVIFRDLDAAVNLSGLPIYNQLRFRFLDILRIVYDVLVTEVERRNDERSEYKTGTVYLIEDFLRGYFYDADYQEASFLKMARQCRDVGFFYAVQAILKTRIIPAGEAAFREAEYSNLVRIDNEYPHFGGIIGQLEKIRPAIAAAGIGPELNYRFMHVAGISGEHSFSDTEVEQLPAVGSPDKPTLHKISGYKVRLTGTITRRLLSDIVRLAPFVLQYLRERGVNRYADLKILRWGVFTNASGIVLMQQIKTLRLAFEIYCPGIHFLRPEVPYPQGWRSVLPGPCSHALTYFNIYGYHVAVDFTAAYHAGCNSDIEIFVSSEFEGELSDTKALKGMLRFYYGGWDWFKLPVLLPGCLDEGIAVALKGGFIEFEHGDRYTDSEVTGSVAAKLPACPTKNQGCVTTLKLPGQEDLLFDSQDYLQIAQQINTHYSRSLTRPELILLRNIIQSRAPPDFFNHDENQGLTDLIQALAQVISLGESNLTLKNPAYFGKPIRDIKIDLINLGSQSSFITRTGRRYYEIATYDELSGALHINLALSFFNRYWNRDDTRSITQTILHPLLEEVLGLSHLEASVALCAYNSDMTLGGKGEIVLPDVYRDILTEIKEEARQGSAWAQEYLNSLLNSDYHLRLKAEDIQAFLQRGKDLKTVDAIRVWSEELARRMNGFVRGRIGKFDTRVDAGDIEALSVRFAKLPTQEALDKYSLSTNTTVAAALALVADGYIGKVTGNTPRGETRIVKDAADGLAKDEFQAVLDNSGCRVRMTVAEGTRDAVENSFIGGQLLGTGAEIVSMAADVLENTNAAAKGGLGATSVAISAEGESGLSGNAPDLYTNMIAFSVPADKAEEFKENPIDPDVDLKDGEENALELEKLRRAYFNNFVFKNTQAQDLSELKEILGLDILERVVAAELELKIIQKIIELDWPNILKLKANIETKVLNMIAQAWGIDISAIRLTILNRQLDNPKEKPKRETRRIQALKLIAREKGLQLNLINDGTFDDGLLALLGSRTGEITKDNPLEISLTTSGLPEGFMDGHIASALSSQGAFCYQRIISRDGIEKSTDLSQANCYNFSPKESQLINTLRPKDAKDILSGNKLFGAKDVQGQVDAAVTFITDNEAFNLPGIKYLGNNQYTITTLRIKAHNGLNYCWVERRLGSIGAVGVKIVPVASSVQAQTAHLNRGTASSSDGLPQTPFLCAGLAGFALAVGLPLIALIIVLLFILAKTKTLSSSRQLMSMTGRAFAGNNEGYNSEECQQTVHNVQHIDAFKHFQPPLSIARPKSSNIKDEHSPHRSKPILKPVIAGPIINVATQILNKSKDVLDKFSFWRFVGFIKTSIFAFMGSIKPLLNDFWPLWNKFKGIFGLPSVAGGGQKFAAAAVILIGQAQGSCGLVLVQPKAIGKQRIAIPVSTLPPRPVEVSEPLLPPALPQLEPAAAVTGHDSSTTGLMKAYKKMAAGLNKGNQGSALKPYLGARARKITEKDFLTAYQGIAYENGSFVNHNTSQEAADLCSLLNLAAQKISKAAFKRGPPPQIAVVRYLGCQAAKYIPRKNSIFIVFDESFIENLFLTDQATASHWLYLRLSHELKHTNKKYFDLWEKIEEFLIVFFNDIPKARENPKLAPRILIELGRLNFFTRIIKAWKFVRNNYTSAPQAVYKQPRLYLFLFLRKAFSKFFSAQIKPEALGLFPCVMKCYPDYSADEASAKFSGTEASGLAKARVGEEQIISQAFRSEAEGLSSGHPLVQTTDFIVDTRNGQILQRPNVNNKRTLRKVGVSEEDIKRGLAQGSYKVVTQEEIIVSLNRGDCGIGITGGGDCAGISDFLNNAALYPEKMLRENGVFWEESQKLIPGQESLIDTAAADKPVTEGEKLAIINNPRNLELTISPGAFWLENAKSFLTQALGLTPLVDLEGLKVKVLKNMRIDERDDIRGFWHIGPELRDNKVSIFVKSRQPIVEITMHELGALCGLSHEINLKLEKVDLSKPLLARRKLLNSLNINELMSFVSKRASQGKGISIIDHAAGYRPAGGGMANVARIAMGGSPNYSTDEEINHRPVSDRDFKSGDIKYDVTTLAAPEEILEGICHIFNNADICHKYNLERISIKEIRIIKIIRRFGSDVVKVSVSLPDKQMVFSVVFYRKWYGLDETQQDDFIRLGLKFVEMCRNFSLFDYENYFAQEGIEVRKIIGLVEGAFRETINSESFIWLSVGGDTEAVYVNASGTLVVKSLLGYYERPYPPPQNFPADAEAIELPDNSERIKIMAEVALDDSRISVNVREAGSSYLGDGEAIRVKEALEYAFNEHLHNPQYRGKLLAWLGAKKPKTIRVWVHGKKGAASDITTERDIEMSLRAGRAPPGFDTEGYRSKYEADYAVGLGLSLKIKFFHETFHLIAHELLEPDIDQATAENLKIHPEILQAHQRIISKEVNNGITAKPAWQALVEDLSEVAVSAAALTIHQEEGPPRASRSAGEALPLQENKKIKILILDLEGVVINTIPLYREVFARMYWEITNSIPAGGARQPASSELEEGYAYFDKVLLGWNFRDKIHEIIEITKAKGATGLRSADEYVAEYDAARNAAIEKIGKASPEALAMPGVRELLASCDENGVDVYIASVANQDRLRILDTLQLASRFKGIKLVSGGIQGKLAAIAEIIKEAKVEPQEAVFVDDTPNVVDVLCQDLNLKNIGIVGFPATPEHRQRMQGKATRIINTLCAALNGFLPAIDLMALLAFSGIGLSPQVLALCLAVVMFAGLAFGQQSMAEIAVASSLLATVTTPKSVPLGNVTLTGEARDTIKTALFKLNNG